MTWRESLLTLYYHGTRAPRQWRLNRLAREGRAPIAILTFHRVADDRATDWTTPTKTFIRALEWLRARFDLISLAEAQRRIRSGHSDRPGVCVTFDDGYAANCDLALPWLVEKGIPCTYFVTARSVLEGRPFDHDLSAGCPLAPNTLDQLRKLARDGIELGAHSRTHPDLGRPIEPERLHDEVVIAREDLQAATGASIRYFAFPYGMLKNLSADAFRVAIQAGYDGVCSAYGGYNYPGGDAFHLQRNCIDNSHIRIQNWASFDFFRNRQIPYFDYRRALVPAAHDSDDLTPVACGSLAHDRALAPRE